MLDKKKPVRKSSLQIITEVQGQLHKTTGSLILDGDHASAQHVADAITSLSFARKVLERAQERKAQEASAAPPGREAEAAP